MCLKNYFFYCGLSINIFLWMEILHFNPVKFIKLYFLACTFCSCINPILPKANDIFCDIFPKWVKRLYIFMLNWVDIVSVGGIFFKKRITSCLKPITEEFIVLLCLCHTTSSFHTWVVLNRASCPVLLIILSLCQQHSVLITVFGV